ncbi:MAG: hypothetical protein HQ582_03200 [Planctomycetes bacterium]|nr:hypothetical protein [Planctomycetota bacterium]
MRQPPFHTENASAAMEAHFLGRVDFGRCLALQQQLVDRSATGDDGQIVLLVCEHPNLVTVGRGGSPLDVQLESHLIRSGQLEVRWVKRGGGCLVHAPGQLAIYPVVPLRWHGFSVGEYLDRLQHGMLKTLEQLGIPAHSRSEQHGIWGRTGQLVFFGIAVRHGVAYHGAFVNVAPPMGLFRLIQSDPETPTRTSCLVAECRKPVKMTSVRAELVRQLADAFGCDRYHLHTGHPLLGSRAQSRR